MKKTRNTFIVIAIVMMLVGAVICGVSFASAGFNGDSFSKSFLGKDVEDKMAEYKSDYNKVTIDVKDRKIDVSKSSDDKIHITYTESEKRHINISENNGELLITEQNDMKWYDYIFTFDFGCKMSIQLPENIEAQLNIYNKNGQIEFSDISIDGDVAIEDKNGKLIFTNTSIKGDLNAETSNGEIKTDKLNVSGKAEIKSSNGANSVENTSVGGELSIKTSNGKIYLYNVKADSISAVTSNGKVEFRDTLVEKEIDAKTSNGKIEGSLIGNQGDFNFRYENSNGSSNVPENGNGGKQAYFKTSNGGIDVRYAQ